MGGQVADLGIHYSRSGTLDNRNPLALRQHLPTVTSARCWVARRMGTLDELASKERKGALSLQGLQV